MFDDMVWDSVRLLDAHHRADDDRPRDWFAVLLAFGRQFDGAVTHFRDIDLLRRRRFVYGFPVARHPDYARRRGYFDGLTEFTALRTFDEEAEDFDGYESELEDGYVEPPLLYCDAGTALWRRMVDAGELTGADAVPPRPVLLVDAVLAVAEAAEHAGDVRLIALWYTLGPHILVGGEVTGDVADQVGRLREIVARTGAMSVPLPDGHRPTDEQVLAMDDEAATWWYLSVTA
ncbi:hypothetical protein GCM10009827_060440 [Dactylosporangium maewongense]|uniref:Uncharacterized protein n=1 Tax=Dactylosporangium maewongense TaxID=634393 RepID=A0ABN2B5D5_9ACTN